MWKDLKISIALCTYNGERFLREQLESYSRQTCLPDEVIVCDDGSTDATLSLLESWSKSVPFNVQIVQNPQNLGYAQNFSKAISLCTGDVIFLSDQDDVWESEKIAKMARVFEENPEVNLVVSDGFIINVNGKREDGNLRSLTELWLYDEPASFCSNTLSINDCFPQGCASAFRATLREVLLPVPSRWAHDVWLQVVAPLTGKGKVLSEPLFSYRLYSGSTSAFGLYQERLKHWKNKKSIAYWNLSEQFWAWLPMIEQFQERLEFLPDRTITRKMKRFLKRNELHFTNRSRIQRNVFLFSWLAVWELLSGGYHARLFPWKSFFYDLRTGLRHVFGFSSKVR